MFVFGNLVIALANLIKLLLTIMYWLILARALISWVNPDPYNTIVQFLRKTTEPILHPIRKILSLNFKIGIDISPLIAILIIFFLQNFLVTTLFDLGFKLRQ